MLQLSHFLDIRLWGQRHCRHPNLWFAASPEDRSSISATTLGIISAPPTPDRACTTINLVKFGMMPLINVQITNQVPPASKTFFWSKTAPSRPLISPKLHPTIRTRIVILQDLPIAPNDSWWKTCQPGKRLPEGQTEEHLEDWVAEKLEEIVLDPTRSFELRAF